MTFSIDNGTLPTIYFCPRRNGNMLFDSHFIKRVLNKLYSLSNKNLFGPDGKPNILLKQNCLILSYSGNYFPNSLNQNVLPLQWKLVDILPVFKKGNISDVENYRSINLTSITCNKMKSI